MKTSTMLADGEITIRHVALDPGDRLAEETHVAQSETVVVLRGEIRLRWSGLVRIVDNQYQFEGPDAGLLTSGMPFIPAGLPHSISNESANVAEYVAIMRRVPEA